jgi:hypothetical protein
MRYLAPLLLLIALIPGLAFADDFTSVELTLAGGEVVGKQQGLGTATVAVKVKNNGDRTLEGIRIAVFYSQIDSTPQPGADWRIHEFVFEPPLIPGGTSTLRFKDENAAEYVLLEARRLKFTAGLRYAGKLASLKQPLLTQEGSTFIALRDLVDIVGGGLSADKAGLTVERGGHELKLGQTAATLDGAPQTLTRLLLEVNGRAYIALEDAARLLGLTMTRDGALDLIELQDAQ